MLGQIVSMCDIWAVAERMWASEGGLLTKVVSYANLGNPEVSVFLGADEILAKHREYSSGVDKIDKMTTLQNSELG